jgi:hypothetical protein
MVSYAGQVSIVRKLGRKPLIFCSAKHFRDFFCFWWQDQEQKWQKKYLMFLPTYKT